MRGRHVGFLCILFMLILISAFSTYVNGSMTNNDSMMNLTGTEFQLPVNEAAAASEKVKLINRLFIVNELDNSLYDDYAFLLTLPLAYFYDKSGTLYASPMFLSQQNIAMDFFIEDLDNIFSNTHSSVSELIYVGDVPYESYSYFSSRFTNAQIKHFSSDNLVSLASQLALYDWKNSDYAVITYADLLMRDTTLITNTSTLHIGEVNQITRSELGSVGSGETVNITLDVSDDYGLAIGTFDWTNNNMKLTYRFINPDEFIVDYATSYYAYLQHNFFGKPLDVWAPLTSGNWTFSIYGDTVSGSENYNLTLTFYPCIRTKIQIPSNTLILNISTEWDDALQNIDIFLFDEHNNFLTASYSQNADELNPSEKIILYNPPPGEYTLVAVVREGAGDIDLNLEISSMTYDQNAVLKLLSASNAAIIASLLNAPLFYVMNNTIDDEVIKTLKALNVSKLVLVDALKLISSGIKTKLSEEGFSDITELTSLKDIIDFIKANTNSTDLILTTSQGYGDELIAAAAPLAVYHKAPLLLVPTDISLWSDAAWFELNRPFESDDSWEVDFTHYDANMDDRAPHRYKMWYLADLFSSFMASYGLETESIETIVTIANLEVLKSTFERAILGKYNPGRIPVETPSDALIFSQRAILYNYLAGAIKKPNSVLVSLVAYSEGATFITNDGVGETVQERISIPDAFKDASYDVLQHTSYQNVLDVLNDGILLWDVSTHGVIANQNPDRYIDNNWLFILLTKQDYEYYIEPGGTADHPDANNDKIVNPTDSNDYKYLRESDFGNTIKNLHGLISIFSACQVGASQHAYLFHKYGSSAVIAALRSIYFNGAGWINVRITSYLAQGKSLGDALRLSLEQASEIYSTNYYTAYSDYSLSVVVFGDPSIKLLPSNYDLNTPLNTADVNASGHTPSHGTPIMALINPTPKIISYLTEHNLDYSIYNISDDTQLTSLLLRLYNFRTIFVNYNSNLSQKFENEICNVLPLYVQYGGRLILSNMSESLDLQSLEFNVISEQISDDTPVPLEDHPIVENITAFPITFNAYFSNVSCCYFKVLKAKEKPVWLEATFGHGKITVTTFAIDNYNEILNSVFNWLQIPIIYADVLDKVDRTVQGYTYTATLHLFSTVGNVSGATVFVDLGNTKVYANETSPGIYQISFTVPDTYTGNTTIIVHIFKDGLNPRKVLLPVEIIEKPWYLKYKRIVVPILLIGIIAITLRLTKPKKKPVMIRVKKK
ncbi:MAG: C25 family cysteine peptidase [Candidatus Asgardarchaeia archaeon]